jgi:hypothetical protein
MDSSKIASGNCLCGKVTIKTEQMNTDVGACHCSMCRKWSAGTYLAVDCGVEAEVDGQEFLGLYQSSDWAERGFCKECGTSLFYRLKATNQLIASASIFDDKEFHFHHQIFIDEKPNYYEFANDTKNMTGAEVMAQFK